MTQVEENHVSRGQSRSYHDSPAGIRRATAPTIRAAIFKIMAISVLLSASVVYGQAVRWDWIAYTLNTSQPLPNAAYPVLGLPGGPTNLGSNGSSAQICATWTVGTVACNSLATTYTDANETSTCASNAQLTPALGGACTNLVDQEADMGAWLAPGSYAYILITTYGSFGPYPFTIGAGGVTQLAIQHNSSASGINQTLLNFCDNGTCGTSLPAGMQQVTFGPDSSGGLAAWTPSSNLSTFTSPPIAGQYIIVNPTTFAVSSCGTSNSASGDDKSGNVFMRGTGTCGDSSVTWTFNTSALPAGVPIANVTAVYPFVVSSSNIMTSLATGTFFTTACSGTGVTLNVGQDDLGFNTNLSYPLAQYTSSTSLTVSTANFNAMTCSITASMIDSGVGNPRSVNGVATLVGAYVYYTGSPVTQASQIYVKAPLQYNSSNSTLSLPLPYDAGVDFGVTNQYAIENAAFTQATAPLNVEFCALNANTSTTPTLNVNGWGNWKIVGPTGAALSAGDIANCPSTGIETRVYLGGNGDWFLKNPQVSGSGGGVTQIIAGTNVTISPSGGTGAVTVNATASGSGDVNGPASSTDGDATVFDGTTGKLIKDAGFAPAPALTNCTDESTTFTPVSGHCYFVTAAVSTATPAASSFVLFTATTSSAGSLALTGTTIADGGSCSGYISGTTLTLTASQSATLYSDGTNIRARCTATGGGGGGGSWSALTNPTANLALTMGGFTSKFSSTDTITGASTYGYIDSSVNGISASTEYAATQPGNSVSGIFGGLSVPSTGTNHQAQGIYGAVNNSSTSVFAVGGYFTGRCLANGTSCWGSNPLAQASTGLTSGATLIGSEVDVNANNTNDQITGILMNGSWGTQPATANGFVLHRVTPSFWQVGFWSQDGATSTAAFYAGKTATTGTVGSQNFDMASAAGVASMNSDSSGNIVLTPVTGRSVNVTNLNISGTCTGCAGLSNTTITIAAATFNANTCSTASTVTITGVATTSVFDFTPSSDLSAVTGWGSTGGLVIMAWPTANTVNYKVCNQTAANITTGSSVTFNVGAR